MAALPSLVAAVAALASVVALAGCVEPPSNAPAAITLDYTLVDLDRDDDVAVADPGQHCGDVRRTPAGLVVSLWPDESRPASPVLAVFPVLPEGWHAMIGAEDFHTALPHTIDPQVDGDATTLGRLDFVPGVKGYISLDGRAISLPHTWSVLGEDGAWRADLRLETEMGSVTFERLQGLCD